MLFRNVTVSAPEDIIPVTLLIQWTDLRCPTEAYQA